MIPSLKTGCKKPCVNHSVKPVTGELTMGGIDAKKLI